MVRGFELCILIIMAGAVLVADDCPIYCNNVILTGTQMCCDKQVFDPNNFDFNGTVTNCIL